MKVILKKRVPSLGYEWDMVNVKNGYARNFLLPQDLASPATPKLIQMAEKRQAERLKKVEETIASAKEIVAKLEKLELSFSQKAKDGKLYGSIAEKDIIEALAVEHKIEVSKNMVKMKEHIKTIGEHKVKLHLTEGVDATLKIKVSEGK